MNKSLQGRFVRSYTTTTHYITLFTCIHKYAMKTHSSGVFPRRMFRPPPTLNFITRGHLLNLLCEDIYRVLRTISTADYLRPLAFATVSVI